MPTWLRALADRFWAKVDKSGGPDACWPWMGSKCKRGRESYGNFLVGSRTDGTRRVVRASRIALELKLGRRIRRNMRALHECDNPECVNPAHLKEGTHSRNMRDMHKRGRHPRSRKRAA